MMRMRREKALILVLAMVLVASCAGKKRDKDDTHSTAKSTAIAPAVPKMDAIATILRKRTFARVIQGKKVDEVIILDGSKNDGKDYTWRQIGGPDLKIPASALNRKTLALDIYQDGDFEFSLSVSKEDGREVTTTVKFSVNRKYADAEP